MENENPPSIYESWKGSGCSLHDTKKYTGQGPKTPSLLSIMLHTEKGHRHARDSLYWIQMSPKEQVYSVKLPRQHQLLMKSWGERWGGLHVQTHIYNNFTNLVISKEEQDESSLLIKPDSLIRSTIFHYLEHHFCKIYALNGELRHLARAFKKKIKSSSLWFNQVSASVGRLNL